MVFKASDGVLDAQTATVTISVTEVNDPLVAIADSKTLNQNTTLSLPATDLIRNDSRRSGREREGAANTRCRA